MQLPDALKASGFGAVCCCLMAAAQGAPVQWTTGPGANGHFYEAFSSLGVSWEAAQAAATSRGGYLATLTSPDENAFVFSLIDNPIYWVNDAAGNSQGPWIGGFQPSGSSEPAGGWQWVHFEGPFVFSNWTSGEPNDANGGENRLQFFATGLDQRAATWNDERAAPYAIVRGYVVEMVPEPSGLALLLVGLAGACLKRCRTARRAWC